MHYALVLVGAHDGADADAIVRRAAASGRVLIVEAVPRLHAQLVARFADVAGVTCVQAAVADRDAAAIPFYAPAPTAGAVSSVGDQLGSLDAGHAVRHDPALAAHVEAITVPAMRFETLFAAHDVTSIETLILDCEGWDARLIAAFPFDLLTPQHVMFEHKHADGYLHIGRNFARALMLLESRGYRTRILSTENCAAIHVG